MPVISKKVMQNPAKNPFRKKALSYMSERFLNTHQVSNSRASGTLQLKLLT